MADPPPFSRNWNVAAETIRFTSVTVRVIAVNKGVTVIIDHVVAYFRSSWIYVFVRIVPVQSGVDAVAAIRIAVSVMIFVDTISGPGTAKAKPVHSNEEASVDAFGNKQGVVLVRVINV